MLIDEETLPLLLLHPSSAADHYRHTDQVRDRVNGHYL
jgi:hypothetical protein